MSDHAEERPPGVQQVNSVLHAVRILELFAAQGQEYLSLTQISRSLGIHKTTVYRLLRTLQSVGWIQQSESNGQYRLGSGILLAASAVTIRRTGHDLITEEMEQLAQRFNEMVVLATVHDGTGICVDLVKSRYNLSMMTAVGYPVPLNAGATGKTLLAAQPDDQVCRLTQHLPAAEISPLLETINQIRTQGYCFSEGEVDLGASAVAVPLHLGDTIYVMSISGPGERLRQIGYESLRIALQESVRRIQQKYVSLIHFGGVSG